MRTASSGLALTSETVVAHGLRLSGGFITEPASPDVAAAYLNIDNTTDRPVRLVSVVTNVTKTVMAMDEKDSGGVGSMTDLSKVQIAAHSSFLFTPGHAHLMLEKPARLVAGERVRMTLTFAGIGAVSYVLPVVPFGQVPGQASSYRSTGPAGSSAPAMPGMSMPARSS